MADINTEDIKTVVPKDRVQDKTNHQNPVLVQRDPGSRPSDKDVFPKDVGHDTQALIRAEDGHHDLQEGQVSSDMNRVTDVKEMPEDKQAIRNIDGDDVGEPVLLYPEKDSKSEEEDNEEDIEDPEDKEVKDARIGSTLGIIGVTIAGALAAGPVGASVGAVASAAAAAAVLDSANRKKDE